jgi:hypothetical protein
MRRRRAKAVTMAYAGIPLQERAMKGLNQQKGDKKKALKTPKEKKAEKNAKKAAKGNSFPGH